jgi:hypothetical protein
MSLRQFILDHPNESDAAIAAALGTPAYIPRSDRVTFTSLGAIWGAVRAAAFHADLKAASQVNDLAGYVFDLLAGEGFDPANADVPAVTQQLVAARLCTADEARDAVSVAVYPLGQTVSEQEVAAERTQLTRDALYAWARQQLEARYVRVVAAIDGGETDHDALAALFGVG